MTENLPARTAAAKILQNKIAAVLSAYPDSDQQVRERFAHICIALANSTDLKDCDPSSVVVAIYGCAALGLVPDKTLGHVYIIPRKSKGKMMATLMPGYRGLMELARRSGAVSYIDARVVYANDAFDVEYGTSPGIKHHPWFVRGQTEPGKPWAAYCVAKLRGEIQYQFDVLTSDEIAAAKKMSQGSDSPYSPWNKYPEEMARKTAVRRASKYWPLSPLLAKAVAWDEQADMGRRQEIGMPQFTGNPQDAKTDPLMDGIDEPKPKPEEPKEPGESQ